VGLLIAFAAALPTLKQVGKFTAVGADGINAVVIVLAVEEQVVVPAALVNTLLAVTVMFPAVVPLGVTTTVAVPAPETTTQPAGNVQV
jgi:hypothetical protein